MPSRLEETIATKFRRKGLISSNEKIYRAFQNNSFFKHTLALTDQRILIHGGIRKSYGKKKKEGTWSFIRNFYTFTYSQITSVNVKNHIFNAELEINDGVSYIVIENMKKNTAQEIVNSIQDMRSKIYPIGNVFPPTNVMYSPGHQNFTYLHIKQSE